MLILIQPSTSLSLSLSLSLSYPSFPRKNSNLTQTDNRIESPISPRPIAARQLSFTLSTFTSTPHRRILNSSLVSPCPLPLSLPLLFISLFHFPLKLQPTNMSLTIPTNLSKFSSFKPKLGNSQPTPKPRSTTILCSASSDKSSDTSSLQAFSAALALSSILLSAPLPAVADISGLTPCKESKQFAKREQQQIKKLQASLKNYAPDSAPALAIKATIEKTKRRFDNYGKQGLLCGSDGLPHLTKLFSRMQILYGNIMRRKKKRQISTRTKP